jgi:hypothetical protein
MAAALSLSGSMSAEAKETPRARQAWADYLALGPGRSLEHLAVAYQSSTGSVPTRQLSRLKYWSGVFGWQDRLQAIANDQVAAAAAAEAGRIRGIMATGFAQPHERVAVLKELADTLLQDLRSPDKRWLRDVKGIGQGENWTQVEIQRFNAAELEQLRGLLDDIAKETGGRPKTIRVDIEHRIRLMARELGLDPDEAVAEAERLLNEAPAR